MGAKQSSPAAVPAANGRTRAYSGSDLPSSTSSGSNGSRTTGVGVRYHAYGASGASSSTSQHHHGARARSVGIAGTRTQSGINIPNSSGAYSSQESGGSSPEEADRERAGGGREGPRLVIGSLPAHLSPHLFAGFKCPVCSKYVSSEEMDLHLVLCLTKPRVTYNEDVLTKDAGECAICLEELVQGDTIARLPCLCIYHKG
ncbi:E3 ubiquitin-protein ligase ZNRF2 [Liparis tanakae]|uniref:RING-type E3 ubiquitin transferase n=1 Tax=Liparis tanakae TaxID=230148 RepID=A0A4Z2GAW0_9TELE|nr:E3 ubiquitin-protein ligase ZNRF2 [Liparis tanakae]